MPKLSPPISPDVVKGARDGDLPAYVSNGLIGLRVREVPLAAGMAIVSGVAGEHAERRVEAAASVPYPLAGDVAVNGVWLSDQPWAASELVQRYDFTCGELHSGFTYRVGEVSVSVEIVTFASRTAPTLVLQQVTVLADQPCDVGLRAVIETAGLRGRIVKRRIDTPGENEPVCDGSMLWAPEGDLSQCGLALHTEVRGAKCEREVRRWDLKGPLRTDYRLRLRAGQRVTLRQIAGAIPSIVHARPDEEALRRVVRGRETGFTELRRRNRNAWGELWKGRIVVRGADRRHQALIDAAFFYLNASTHPASPAATSIFGLSTWHDYHYYFGHVMWDVDAFCIPPLMLLQPDAARSLLDFRTRGIDAARSYARLSDRRGLQFPWEAAPMSGQESAPGPGSAAAHEDHGSLHVARAFALHADITGDGAFRDDNAWPIVSGVADWFVSRVTRTRRGYELLRATGPAEVPTPPNNDAFTLMAGEQVLRHAIRMASETGRPAKPEWVDVADRLYLPIRADGVIAAHDDFRVSEPKGATPSPLGGLFPYNFPLDDVTAERTLAFYLEHWRAYVGAPMFPALYCVWASMSGDRTLALKLFEEGYAAYDHPRFHQCLEYRTDKMDGVAAGPFFANLGGLLFGLLFGLTGLRIDDGNPVDWPSRPVVLPKGWDAVEIERIWIHGRAARLIARHGAERAELVFT